jgi:glycine/D-amino acid oxidase-like deaminating enzyme
MKSFDVLVVGAGIVGSAVARESALEGWRVGVLAGGKLSGSATAAGMGHLVVMDDSPAQLALTAYSRSLWHTLAPHLPKSAEYESCGTIWVAADDEELAEARAKCQVYAAHGIDARVLSSEELAAAEPNLRERLAGGLLVPADGVIYPPTAANYFLDEAKHRGAQVFADRAITAANNEVRLTDGTTLTADRIVLAVGTDCTLLPALPIQKRKGHLVITDRYPNFVRHQLVELGYLKSAHKLTDDSVAFNVQPRQTGQLLIGSSRQYGSGSSEIDTEILRRMLDRAIEYMPGLRNLSSLRAWTGFRAATPDKLPLIGRAIGLSDDPSLWLAAGFEGLGITNAPGAARLLVDAMTARPSAIDATPYLPTRLSQHAEVAHA